MHTIGVGIYYMMYIYINCSDDTNVQQLHIATFVPPDPILNRDLFLQEEADYVSLFGRERVVD